MINLIENISNSFSATAHAIENFIQEKQNFTTLAVMASSMAASLSTGNKIMACGNGGSACQAMHFAEELTGRYRLDRAPLPALALTDAAHITCVGNDYGFDQIFARSILAYGQAGDGVLLLSTSGNSANLLQVLEVAKTKGLISYAILGKDGGKLKGKCDYELIVDAQMPDCIQNLHMIIIHCLIELIERELFPKNYYR